jgi:hypothetical protein
LALTRLHRTAAAGLALAPVAFTLLLSAMRPDLVAPLLQHVFGYLAAALLLVLATAGAGAALLGWWLTERFARRPAWRLVLSFLSGGLPFLLFTVPALMVALFSPILFAFMYGERGASGEDARQLDPPVAARPADTRSLIREYPER